jgi:signal recognition particle receptor subunit beta
MVQMNFARKEVKCKIVYYGPGLSGKTTNIEVIHDKAPPTNRGELTSIATEGDRTLFFDFMPLDLGKVHGMDTKFKLYTVPGQVYYNSTRKLVLQGADGVVFVADSQRKKMQENIESLENLQTNLSEYKLDIATIPFVIQYNKRDLPDVATIEELNEKLNPWGVPHFEAVAFQGHGVFPTLKTLVGLVLARVVSAPTNAAPPKRPTPAPNSLLSSNPAAATPIPATPNAFAGNFDSFAPPTSPHHPPAPQKSPSSSAPPPPPRPGGPLSPPPRPGGPLSPPPRPGGMAPPPPRPGGPLSPPPRPGGPLSPPPRPGGMAPPPPRPGGMAPPPPRPGGMAPPPPRPGGMAPPPPRPGGMAPPPQRPGGMAPQTLKKKE